MGADGGVVMGDDDDDDDDDDAGCFRSMIVNDFYFQFCYSILCIFVYLLFYTWKYHIVVVVWLCADYIVTYKENCKSKKASISAMSVCKC